jgi:hypothetical protein
LPQKNHTQRVSAAAHPLPHFFVKKLARVAAPFVFDFAFSVHFGLNLLVRRTPGLGFASGRSTQHQQAKCEEQYKFQMLHAV